MALPTSILSKILILFLLIGIATAIPYAIPRQKKTHLRVYFHGILSGPNRTSDSVAALNGVTNAFGNVQVLDNWLRIAPQHDAKVIGKAQGIAVRSSMEDASMMAVVNFVFTEGKYKGSTITLTGRVDASGYGDRTINGGGGQFRLATGFATSSNVDKYVDTQNLVVQFDFYLVYYEDKWQLTTWPIEPIV